MFNNRLIFIVYCLVITIAGLLSRSPLISQQSFLGMYSGDTLWAMLVTLVFSVLLWGKRPVLIFCISLLFSFVIEITQLYHSPWIDSIRAQKIGGLILGFGFKWSDIICYTVGVITGSLLYTFNFNASSLNKK